MPPGPAHGQPDAPFAGAAAAAKYGELGAADNGKPQAPHRFLHQTGSAL
jgi:hypothetical protein